MGYPDTYPSMTKATAFGARVPTECVPSLLTTRSMIFWRTSCRFSTLVNHLSSMHHHRFRYSKLTHDKDSSVKNSRAKRVVRRANGIHTRRNNMPSSWCSSALSTTSRVQGVQPSRCPSDPCISRKTCRILRLAVAVQAYHARPNGNLAALCVCHKRLHQQYFWYPVP